MHRIAIALAIAAAMAGPALASGQITLGRAGMDNVFVWRDDAAFSEAIKLIQAKVQDTNPALVLRLLSCIAKPGDHAVVTDGGFASSTILVIDGANAGCRGDIANEDIR